MGKVSVTKTVGGFLRSVVMDGWFNLLTGLGTSTVDKRMNAQIDWFAPTEYDVDSMYASDDIAAKVVDLLPEDAMREGLRWLKATPEQEKGIEAEYDRLKVLEKLQLAWKWGRLYGGGLAVIMTDDAAPLDEELDLNSIRSIKSIVPLTRWEVFPFEWDYDIESANFGYPRLYQIQPRVPTTGQAMFTIHHSRVIRFDGPQLPTRLSIMNWRWGDSVLTRLRVPLINYASSFDSAASSVTDFRVNIFKLRNLSGLMAAGNEALVQKRLQLINMTKSIAKAVVVEEGEEYETNTTTFTGLPEILDKMKMRVQAAAQIPHTKLFGESPSGLGATGRHEEVNWYDFVKSKQVQVLTPRLDRINDLIFAQRKGPFGGVKPDEMAYEFAPLWQLDEKEEADMRYVMAQSDQIYIQNGVLQPQDVANSRFGGQQYSIETKLETVEYQNPLELETEPKDTPILDDAEMPSSSDLKTYKTLVRKIDHGTPEEKAKAQVAALGMESKFPKLKRAVRRKGRRHNETK